MNLVRKLYNIFRPIVLWISKVRMPYTKKQVIGADYYNFRDMIKPGAILLSTTHGEFSNLLNPSEYKHGALYIGGDKVKYVIEATLKGVHLTTLASFLLTKDSVAVYGVNATNEDIREMVKCSRKYIGIKYDDYFKAGAEKLYCFELLSLLVEKYTDIKEVKARKFLNEYVYTSESFTDDEDSFRLILDMGAK